MQKRRNKLLAALNTYLFYGQQVMVIFSAFFYIKMKSLSAHVRHGNSMDTSWFEARYGIDFSSGRKRSVLSSG